MSTGRRQIPIPLPPGSLSNLRQWARSWMEQHPSDAECDSVILVMTEMVTNSVRYGCEPITVDLVETLPTLMLCVSDGSSDKPLRHTATTGDEGGRGLTIYDALTGRWGVWLNPGAGKTVWCEFPGPATRAHVPRPSRS